jgi:REP element-mobilizing transposase RayT
MARKLRIQYAGAFYHVINRGNYRSWIFESLGSRHSFLECLDLSCKAKGWRLHAWCLMGNHYHLLIETPQPNLVDGMKWLQSTFANRFNRFRKSNGHVFQGRYKSILLDANAVGSVCHYIHLNPVRAGLADVGRLQEYKDSSFYQLWHPRQRWDYGDYQSCLEAAGGLADKPKGRSLYRDYLGWLSTEDSEQKRIGFEKMSRGWAKGSKAFKKAVIEDLGDERVQQVVEAEASEMREPRWEKGLAEALIKLHKGEKDLVAERKGADWKVALARHLRERYLAPHKWIADRLVMGAPSSVQCLVSRHRKLKLGKHSFWRKLNHE